VVVHRQDGVLGQSRKPEKLKLLLVCYLYLLPMIVSSQLILQGRRVVIAIFILGKR
jgi:hypothetical protein